MFAPAAGQTMSILTILMVTLDTHIIPVINVTVCGSEQCQWSLVTGEYGGVLVFGISSGNCTQRYDKPLPYLLIFYLNYILVVHTYKELEQNAKEQF